MRDIYKMIADLTSPKDSFDTTKDALLKQIMSAKYNEQASSPSNKPAPKGDGKHWWNGGRWGGPKVPDINIPMPGGIGMGPFLSHKPSAPAPPAPTPYANPQEGRLVGGEPMPAGGSAASLPSLASPTLPVEETPEELAARIRSMYSGQTGVYDNLLAELAGMYNTNVANTKDRAKKGEQKIGGIYDSLVGDLTKNRKSTEQLVGGNQKAANSAYDVLQQALNNDYGNVQKGTNAELSRLGLTGAANGSDTTASDLQFLQGLAGADRAATTASMQSSHQGFNDMMNGSMNASGFERAGALTSNDQRLQDTLAQLSQDYFGQKAPLMQQKGQLNTQIEQAIQQAKSGPSVEDQLKQAQITHLQMQDLGGGSKGVNMDQLSGPAGAYTLINQLEKDPVKAADLARLLQTVQSGKAGMGLSPEPINMNAIVDSMSQQVKELGYGPEEQQIMLQAIWTLMGKGGSSGGAYALTPQPPQ